MPAEGSPTPGCCRAAARTSPGSGWRARGSVAGSGGLLGAHPVIAAGLIRLIEAARQVRGQAGEMQVKEDIGLALAHGVNGVCGQSHCVWILGRDGDGR